ncbi:MAG: T9SS type A sorting domain-containing protein [Lewinellaceae bacterium]|nr:T9SS type A sorting domain-containing protein [Lewinellaceae bacterium]
MASITIGAAAASVGTYGIYNGKTFNNNTGGQIRIDRSTGSGIYNFSAGNFTNVATITIGAGGSVGIYGIANEAVFNNTSGQIKIDRSTSVGLYNLNAGTFTNVATITIGAVASVGLHGIHNNATFNNNTGGQINIDRATTSGILINAGTFSNAASTTIGALVQITNLMTPGSGTFSNNTGGVLKGAGTLPAAAFTHAGGQLAPGYSPGKMTFNDAENFSNSILAMEVAGGGGVAGTDFDQIVVTGTATLGGTLTLSFNYPAPADGTQIIILDATSLTGTFSLVTGLPSGWAVNYDVPSAGKVSLVYTVALPVELTHFSARLSGRWVQLDWQTASEHHNAGFYIERSADGMRWSELGFVVGQGDATEAQHYSFADENPSPGLNYYRLRQTDLDGQIEFSPVVSITVEGKGAGFSVFPNPVSQGELNLRFSEKTSKEDLEVRLFNAAGQLVKSVTLNPENDLRINVSGLPPGAYALEVKNGRMRFCEKVMID